MHRFLLAALLTIASAAHAQNSEDDQARALFEAGHTAYDAGRFEQALRYFQEAYDLSHRAALLFNIASAADRLLLVDRALAAYEQYLQAMPNAQNRELAQSRIDFLRLHAGAAQGVQQPSAGVAMDNGPRRTTGGGGDVTGEWWFWTLLAVLVVGAGVGITAGIVAGTSGVQGPLSGDTPVTMALEGR